jgi:GT2 family glycosyltransferase
VKIKYQEQTNQGASKARNTGIKQCKNDIILMIDDDIIATPELVSEHMKWHNQLREEKVAVLGYITWSPEVKVDDFMWWCENGGPLTRYHLIKNKQEVDFAYLYTGNLSLKASLLRNNLFDQDFFLGFDDLELGYRLSRQGLRIFYDKDAVGYHLSSFDMNRFVKRMRSIAKSAKILHKKWPELADKIGKPRPLLLLRIAKPVSFLLYPLAQLAGWKRMIYHYRYQNRLSTEYARAYYEQE